MAFLRLNGVTVPVTADNMSKDIIERSNRVRSASGKYITATVFEKRRFQGTTTPLTEMEALAFEGLINGDGDILTFDDTTASTKGLDASGSVTIAYSTTVPTWFTGKSGTVSNAGEVYDLGIGAIKAYQDLTINLWTNPSATDPGALQYLFNFSDKTATYKNSARAYRTTDGKLNFKVSASDSTGSSDKTSHLYINDPFDGNWKMLTFVVRRSAESGEYNQYLYVNAALQAYATTAYTPTPTAWNEWIIASGGANGQDWNNKIDDFQILPYAATSDLITGWYNFGQNVGQHPKLKMDGDITRDTMVNVRGNVMERKFTYLGGRLRQTLTFDLTEV